MRVLTLIFCGLAMSACATTTPTQNTSTDISQSTVSQSSLKPGDCGLFGWSTGADREFIFFADKTTARYNGANGPVDLMAQSTFPATDYLDSAGNSVSLRLGEGELMNGGMRYPGARIVTVSSEGWERLQPVALIQGCQS